MSHELRTPMNGIIGNASLLQLSGLDADQSVLVDTIDDSASALLELLNEILDLSKIEAGKFELDERPFDLAACAKSVVDLLEPRADDKGLELELQLASGLITGRQGDAMRVRQVLMNLVGNALKFTEQGRVSIAIEGDAQAVSIAVSDTGIGIPAARLARIFDDFEQADSSTTRRFGGTGLGLAISRRIVEQMGGELRVESREGEGATFRFELPLAGVELLERPLARRSLPAFRTNARVLLAEDNEINQRLVLTMLERVGCTVHLAHNGREAVEHFAPGRWDLVLLDWQMPELSGLDAAREIRRIEGGEPVTPLVALTANAMSGDREACLEAGMNDYLAKPIRFESLVDMLARWLPEAA